MITKSAVVICPPVKSSSMHFWLIIKPLVGIEAKIIEFARKIMLFWYRYYHSKFLKMDKNTTSHLYRCTLSRYMRCKAW